MSRIEILAILICGGFLALGLGMMSLGMLKTSDLPETGSVSPEQMAELRESSRLMLAGALVVWVSSIFTYCVGLSLRWRRER